MVEVRNEQQNEKSKLKEEINQMKSEVRNMKTMERQLNKVRLILVYTIFF